MDYVIGCDIGSQSVKTILLSADGKIVGETGVNYSISYPQPTWAEQPAEIWLSSLGKSIHTLLSNTNVNREMIRAISLAAQVDGVVPVDRAGKPLRPAIIWMDRRAVEQCERSSRLKGKDYLFQISGLNLDPSHVAPKIRWIQDHESQIYAKTCYFLLPGSYVAYALTGELAVDYSNASSTLLMDVRSREWSPELCELFNISSDSLAKIKPSTSVIGTLLPSIAEELGLLPETILVLGSGDEHAACIGAGVIMPGLVCDIAGTAEPVCAASSSVIFDPTGLIETHCHADPDAWLLENPGFVSGANYRWFRDQFAPREVETASLAGGNAYDLLNDLASSVPIGSDGLIFLPCLMGAMTPTWNALARGTYFGFTLAHTRAHFVRALLEASAYAVRDIIEQMLSIGLPLHQIRVVGGGARSRFWRQIKADVTGLPVVLPQTIETTALGAGILGLVGIGAYASITQAATQVVNIMETIEPDLKRHARYEEYYRLYQSTYFALLPVFDQAARIKPV
jgi:xylulokinase